MMNRIGRSAEVCAVSRFVDQVNAPITHGVDEIGLALGLDVVKTQQLFFVRWVRLIFEIAGKLQRRSNVNQVLC